MSNTFLMLVMGSAFVLFVFYLAYDSWKDFSKQSNI